MDHPSRGAQEAWPNPSRGFLSRIETWDSIYCGWLFKYARWTRTENSNCVDVAEELEIAAPRYGLSDLGAHDDQGTRQDRPENKHSRGKIKSRRCRNRDPRP